MNKKVAQAQSTLHNSEYIRSQPYIKQRGDSSSQEKNQSQENVSFKFNQSIGNATPSIKNQQINLKYKNFSNLGSRNDGALTQSFLDQSNNAGKLSNNLGESKNSLKDQFQQRLKLKIIKLQEQKEASINQSMSTKGPNLRYTKDKRVNQDLQQVDDTDQSYNLNSEREMQSQYYESPLKNVLDNSIISDENQVEEKKSQPKSMLKLKVIPTFDEYENSNKAMNLNLPPRASKPDKPQNQQTMMHLLSRSNNTPDLKQENKNFALHKYVTRKELKHSQNENNLYNNLTRNNLQTQIQSSQNQLAVNNSMKQLLEKFRQQQALQISGISNKSTQESPINFISTLKKSQTPVKQIKLPMISHHHRRISFIDDNQDLGSRQALPQHNSVKHNKSKTMGINQLEKFVYNQEKEILAPSVPLVIQKSIKQRIERQNLKVKFEDEIVKKMKKNHINLKQRLGDALLSRYKSTSVISQQ
ncbi:UNKNOWN [Stylonychia lemnae]|uniref:Uncharacterized protein n=1 Tax=Stylonychia lemnae TaxID=5949 RepID=A0A078A3E6_STYLE|nr:UNKNOWN [Stylonychia lemnae]|eukprot:CDW76803.1 UNKNOWN [Stylonychia lemnae]